MSDRIRVGDRDLTIAEFSSYKFFEATDILARILEVVPELDTDIEEFAKSYMRRTAITLDRATAEMRFGEAAKHVSEETWQRNDQKLVIEDSPSGMQIGLRVWPKVQRHAREDAEWLLALVATPNSELERDDERGVDPYGDGGSVHDWRKFVRHNATPSQVLKLLVAATTALWSEIEAGNVMDDLGKLLDKLRPPGETEKEPDKPARPRRSKVAGAGAPPSSTRSRARTKDGRVATSSIASPTGS